MIIEPLKKAESKIIAGIRNSSANMVGKATISARNRVQVSPVTAINKPTTID